MVIELADKSFDGVQIWILFKLFVIMPLAGVFGWWQTKKLFKYRLPDPQAASANAMSSVAIGTQGVSKPISVGAAAPERLQASPVRVDPR